MVDAVMYLYTLIVSSVTVGRSVTKNVTFNLITIRARVCLQTTLCPEAMVELLSLYAWIPLSLKGKSRARKKGFRFLGGDIHKYIPPCILCWQSRPTPSRITHNITPFASSHSLLVETFLLFLHLTFFLGSGINWRTSIGPTVGGQEENTNFPSGGNHNGKRRH